MHPFSYLLMPLWKKVLSFRSSVAQMQAYAQREPQKAAKIREMETEARGKLNELERSPRQPLISIRFKGLSELQKFLDDLPAKMEANVMRGALRAGMNVVKPVAQNNIRSVSGLLADGLKISTRIGGGKVTASLKTTGEHAFVAQWVEFGTSAHKIAAKRGGALSFYGIFAKSVAHPGAVRRPFMRPALDQEAENAVIAAAEYMKKRLATREGLDTSEVLISGEDE